MSSSPGGVPSGAPPNHPLLDGLTEEQIEAVCHRDGPLILFAGPGAGKTKTITHRIAWLLASRQAAPSEILAVTFAVRAAGEMRLRLQQLLGVDGAAGITVATFHSVCARVLRAHAATFGRTDAYTIYDEGDQSKALAALINTAPQENPDLAALLADFGEPPSGDVLGEISTAKNKLWTPEFYLQHSKHPTGALIGRLWQLLDAELASSNAFTFDDLLLCTVRLLDEHPALLAHYRARFKWILVDEYQDTNYAQMALVSLLGAPDGNVTVIGDDDQLLYSWRGAEIDNVLRFDVRFPNVRRIVLQHNFRCRAEILERALDCIRHNPTRVAKQLIAVRGPGGQVETPAFADDSEEARWIASDIQAALSDGVDSEEILVVCRNAFAMRPLERALAEAGIPHRVLGTLGLYERSEIRDAVAYLGLIANALDQQAFRRAVSAPRRGVGEQTASHVVAFARDFCDGDLISACQQADMIGAIRSQQARQALKVFGSELDRVRRELWNGRSLSHTVIGALTCDEGIVRHYQSRRDKAKAADDRRDAERVLEDLRSLVHAAGAYENADGDATLTGFLERANGIGTHEVEGEDRRLTMATIHRAKGTEAQIVYLIGAEERLLPSWRAIEAGDVDEERRVFYVAMTRAKDRLVCSRAAMRSGRPADGASRFLFEAGL